MLVFAFVPTCLGCEKTRKIIARIKSLCSIGCQDLLAITNLPYGDQVFVRRRSSTGLTRLSNRGKPVLGQRDSHHLTRHQASSVPHYTDIVGMPNSSIASGPTSGSAIPTAARSRSNSSCRGHIPESRDHQHVKLPRGRRQKARRRSRTHVDKKSNSPFARQETCVVRGFGRITWSSLNYRQSSSQEGASNVVDMQLHRMGDYFVMLKIQKKSKRRALIRS